jgi:DNA transposition AAA+ family ATPase
VTSNGEDTAFIETKQYRRFKEFCDACRKYKYIGLCYGAPGVGKTLSARHYAEWDKLDAFLYDRHHNRMKLPEVLHCNVIFFTASAAVANGPVKIDRAIEKLRDSLTNLRHRKIQEEEEADLFAKHDLVVQIEKAPRNPRLWWHQECAAAWEASDAFKAACKRYVERCREVGDPTSLIIVDEVDLLKMAGLEQLRAIFDRGGIGLVLIGMPGLEKRLARYPQLYSRVGFVHEFKPLSQADVRQLLREGWSPSGVVLPDDGLIDEEAIATLIRIAEGKFRLLHRLLQQIARVMEINTLDRVTVPVVEAARESLVIGMA